MPSAPVRQALSCFGESCRYFGSDQGLLNEDSLGYLMEA